jgi:hypothetical protein
MIKEFFAILCLLCFAGAASAQRTFKAGLVAGVNATQYDGDTYSGYNKPGFYGGGFVRSAINEKWDWTFELCLSQKGARKTPTDNSPNQYFLVLDYVEVPVLVRYRYKKVLFEGGMGFGVLFRTYEEVGYISIKPRPFHRLEWSSDVGIAYMLSQRLTAGVRHTYSILPVRPHASGATWYRNLGESNNVLTFAFRYEFGEKDPE